MTSPTDLRHLEQRPLQYWNIDGIPELVMGAVWIVWGAALIIGEHLPRGGAWRLYWMVVPAILVLSGVAANGLTQFLKRRITYPRTGYVALREPSRALRLATAAIAVVSAAVVAGLVARGRMAGAGSAQTTPIALGILIALAFLVLSVRQGAPHLLALAGVALVLGVAMGTLGAQIDGLNWLIGLLGIASAALGAIRLSRYLRRHPLGDTQ